MAAISYLITIFAALYWIFRVVVVYTFSLGINFIVTPMNMNIEIAIIFITLFSFIFIVKRNVFGALLYFVCYGWYFGTSLYNELTSEIANSTSVFFSILALAIAVLLLLDIFLNKDRKNISDDRTKWFFKNKKFDRNLDERTDKNKYKFF